MITFSSLQLRRGVKLLLDKSNATIHPGQKVGLVGKNGTGKSTLFALLKGNMVADAGDVALPKQWALAWVNQETPALDRSALDYVIDGDREFRMLERELEEAHEQNDGHKMAMLYSKMDAIDAWTIQSRAAVLLAGLGFEQSQYSGAVKAFSGGWRMRLNLAQALICRSDLLLLDEPTNHLDLEAVVWLEKWLKAYQGTLILISHDRDFLDPLVNKILHIDQQKLTEYSGNYSDFEVQRAAKLAQQQFLFEQQQQKISHLQSYIARFSARAATAKQAQSRMKALERMEQLAPIHVDNPFQFAFPIPDALPNPLLKIQNVAVGYGDKVILDNVKLDLSPTSRIGLLGLNGAGKSTLIKLLAGELAPMQGEATFSKGVNIGYFAQHQLEAVDAESSALVQLRRIADSKVTEQKLRDYLGGFGFKGDKVNEPVATFSGGEKARLVLALLIWKKPNLLLLDEPTNHLDLDMREALTQALLTFEGALIVVSHDRHLLRSTTDEFYLVSQGQVRFFDGDLEHYQTLLFNNNDAVNSESSHVKKGQRKGKKRQDNSSRRDTQKLQQEATLIERRLSELREHLAKIEYALSDPTLYHSQSSIQLDQFLQEQQLATIEIQQLEERWFECESELDELA